MGFGSAVRAKRKAAGLTLEQLSERTNVTPNYLGRVETEKADPSLSIVQAIARALKTSVGELLEGAEAPSAREKTRRRRSFTPDEREVASLYADLPLDVKESVLPLVRSVAKRLRRRRC
jgi:transcriptional regulator with XRE-family HTH domain